jgi:hypothetical protein
LGCFYLHALITKAEGTEWIERLFYIKIATLR